MNFDMLWDLGNFTQGTQVVCNTNYPNYIETFIVFLDLKKFSVRYMNVIH